ncbi:MAG: T9SS type A sorting domain-containing protein, partial [Bacteroidota bacterium]
PQEIQHIRLLDAMGRELRTVEIEAESILQWSLNDLSAGWYLLQAIGTNGQIETRKVEKR